MGVVVDIFLESALLIDEKLNNQKLGFGYTFNGYMAPYNVI